MSSVRPHQRVFALTMAVLFLVTTVVGSVIVIWQIKQENEINSALTELNQPATPTTTNNEEKTMLQGTKLANFEPTSSVTELTKIDTVVGTGEEAKAGATVTAHYTGAVAATGVIFQSSKDMGQPIPFGLDQVIKGWTDGVPGMKVGGIRRLVIPADQAYGANPPGGSGIPTNAALVFDIELTAVQNK